MKALLYVGVAAFFTGAAANSYALTPDDPRRGNDGADVELPPNQEGESRATLFGFAELQGVGGSGVTGRVEFRKVGRTVDVLATLRGARPGQHGIHVHEFGDCSASDASSAGDHFDPEGSRRHGEPNHSGVHAGDLGNIRVDKSGRGELRLTLRDGDHPGIAAVESPFIGRSIVVHETIDDLSGQPAGNAGGRIACGVVITSDVTALSH